MGSKDLWDFTADHLDLVSHLPRPCQDMYEQQQAKLYPEDAGIQKEKQINFFADTEEIAQTATANVSES